MPIIKGADLTSVSTERKVYREGEYVAEITKQEFSEDERFLIITHKFEEAPDNEDVGQSWQNWIYLQQDDGKLSEIGLQTIKRYLEAVFGKGSPETQGNPPDTDPLTGNRVRLYLISDSWKDKKSGEDRTGNKAKRIMAA